VSAGESASTYAGLSMLKPKKSRKDGGFFNWSLPDPVPTSTPDEDSTSPVQIPGSFESSTEKSASIFIDNNKRDLESTEPDRNDSGSDTETVGASTPKPLSPSKDSITRSNSPVDYDSSSSDEDSHLRFETKKLKIETENPFYPLRTIPNETVEPVKGMEQF
jgi:hypothetical protein